MNEPALMTPTTDPTGERLAVAIEATLRRAEQVGAPLTFVGIHPLPDQILRFRGYDRDWVLAPLHLDPILTQRGDFPVPSVKLPAIDVLLGDGFDPIVFVGHDVPPEHQSIPPVVDVDLRQGDQSLAAFEAQATMPLRGGRVISPEEARLAVPLVSAPRRTRELSERFAHISDVMIKGLVVAGTITFAVSVAAVGIAFAPLFVGVATAGVAFEDPIVFGAVPLTREAEAGSPGAWFVVSAWDYD